MTNLNDLSQKLINTYQKKICCYDKQQWERSIEDQILYRAENICGGGQSQNQSPNGTSHDRHLHTFTFSSSTSTTISTSNSKVPSMTNDLIDLDLISGSAYTVKAKSQQGWLSALGHAVLRVLLFPLYIRWWADRTGARLTLLLLLLYLLEVVSLRLYYHRGITLLSVQNFGGNETVISSAKSGNGGGNGSSNSSSSTDYSEVSPTEVLMPIAMAFVLGVIHTQIVGTKTCGGSNSSNSNSSSSTSSSSSTAAAAATLTTTSGLVNYSTTPDTTTTLEIGRKGSCSISTSGAQHSGKTTAVQSSSSYTCCTSATATKATSAHIDHSSTSQLTSSCGSSSSSTTPSSSTTASPPSSLERHSQRKLKRAQAKKQALLAKKALVEGLNRARGSSTMTSTSSSTVPKIHIQKEIIHQQVQFDGGDADDDEDEDEYDDGVAEDSVSLNGGSEEEEVEEFLTSYRHHSSENLWVGEDSPTGGTPRRYSESASRRGERSNRGGVHLVLRPSQNTAPSFTLCRRRYSESQLAGSDGEIKSTNSKVILIQQKSSSTLTSPLRNGGGHLVNKHRLLNSCPSGNGGGGNRHRYSSYEHHQRPSKLFSRRPQSVSNVNGSGSNTLSAKPYKRRHYHGSSVATTSLYDSEGTVSPVTPIASLPGDDWPMINSDANTSGESDDDGHDNDRNNAHQFATASVQQQQIEPVNFNRQKSKTTTSDYESNGGGGGSSARSCRRDRGDRGGRCYKSCCQKSGESSGDQQQQHGSHRNSKASSIEKNTSNGNSIESPANQEKSTQPPPPPPLNPPPPLLNSTELKVSCSVWQHNLWQKVDLSVMDLSSAIIRKVEGCEHSSEYIYLGVIFSVAIALLPSIFRMQYLPVSTSSFGILSPVVSSVSGGASSSLPNTSDGGGGDQLNDYLIQVVDLYGLLHLFLDASLFYGGGNLRLRVVIAIAMLQRFVLSLLYFFLLCVAERTFKQRFLYSKYFSQITRRDRAKRSQVPFFRLHKVSYLKVWLSVRSYLRRHGPLRSVDTICSTSFILAVCLLTCICLQLLKDDGPNEAPFTSRLICWEMIFWSLAIGIYIMRLMILGSRINQKYRSNLSVLITEQINLHLQLERKPQKKEDLMLANHVLKLAADLIKELEAPYKISGFSANPYLYNITKVVVLSAFSALLTEMLGFKLKLDKINLIK